MAATFERASVTAELARAMIEAAERKAAEMGQPFVIAIVDDSGVLKAFSRMEDRKSTRLNSSHQCLSRMPSSA